MNSAAPYPARQCAARARDLAQILTSRAAGSPHRAVLLLIAGCLRTMADAFATEVPPVLDGVVITNTIPAEAGIALMQAVTAAQDHPEAGVTPALLHLVTAPKSGRRAASRLTRIVPQGDRRRAQLLDLLGSMTREELELSRTDDPSTRYRCLDRWVDLHREWLHLAAGVEAEGRLLAG